MRVITVHGNGATPQGWAYIKKCLPEHTYHDLSYTSDKGFTANLERMQDELAEILMNNPEETFYFISHSLGGLYALYLAASFPENTVGVITMATPFAGCEHAPVLGMFFPSKLFSDIAPHSHVIRKLARTTIACPITAIVTTDGQSSIWVKVNDSIVSRESMMSRKDVTYVEVHASHFEVLLNDEAIGIIREAIENVLTNGKETV